MIKVRVGQVWENGSGAVCVVKSILLGPCNKGVAVVYNETGDRRVIAGGFSNFYKFIPQNDLEWLAVNVDKWNGHKFLAIFDDSFIARWRTEDWTFTKAGHTRTEWQNMRYHLGLDKKPHYRSIRGEWVKQ